MLSETERVDSPQPPERPFRVVVVDLDRTGVALGGERPAAGPPSKTLAAAVKKARSLTDGGMLRGPVNETRVLDASGAVLHRFRKLTHGSLGRNSGSFRARPCEVDAAGNPGTTVRILGVAGGPEVGSAFVGAMLEGARTRLRDPSSAFEADGVPNCEHGVFPLNCAPCLTAANAEVDAAARRQGVCDGQ